MSVLERRMVRDSEGSLGSRGGLQGDRSHYRSLKADPELAVCQEKEDGKSLLRPVSGAPSGEAGWSPQGRGGDGPRS